MFERLTESAKRAIFFARATTHWNDAPSIDSSHLLYGLMWDDDSRAHVLFRLRESFPLYRECPYKFADLEAAPKRNPPLTDYAKKILARTVMQADAMANIGLTPNICYSGSWLSRIAWPHRIWLKRISLWRTHTTS
jgi:hypothetical protein